MPEPIRIAIEHIQKAEEFRKYINSLDLDNIEITENGQVYPLPKERIEEFRVCGLSNWTWLADGLFKTDFVTLFLHEEERRLLELGFHQKEDNIWIKPGSDGDHQAIRNRRSFTWKRGAEEQTFNTFGELDLWLELGLWLERTEDD